MQQRAASARAAACSPLSHTASARLWRCRSRCAPTYAPQQTCLPSLGRIHHALAVGLGLELLLGCHGCGPAGRASRAGVARVSSEPRQRPRRRRRWCNSAQRLGPPHGHEISDRVAAQRGGVQGREFPQSCMIMDHAAPPLGTGCPLASPLCTGSLNVQLHALGGGGSLHALNSAARTHWDCGGHGKVFEGFKRV